MPQKYKKEQYDTTRLFRFFEKFSIFKKTLLNINVLYFHFNKKVFQKIFLHPGLHTDSDNLFSPPKSNSAK